MEARVAGVHDLAVGTMRKVAVGDRSCLLVKTATGFHAYPAQCPHYHGPLELGVLDGERLVCPWHQAVFSAEDGDLLEPPSFFGLPSYQVRRDGDDVYVTVPDDDRGTRAMPMTDLDLQADRRTVLILGAGAAGAGAAEALRQAGFAGRIVMISAEDRLPYDRPNCSKDLLSGAMPASWMPLRSAAFYEKRGIERLHGRVTAADVRSRTLTLEDGVVLTGDALLLAPGGAPRRLSVPGAELDGVFTLRSWDDCESIVAALEGARSAVVIGASFIGLEVAASLRHRDLDVTVVALEEVPFARLFGPGVGTALRTLHEEHGVGFRLGRTVTALDGDGRVHGVTLDDGSELPADIVVVGIGVQPATGFVDGALTLSDGALSVDAHLRVAPGVWAAGDIAAWPAAHTGLRVRIEHWRLALQHGRAAAFDIAGRGAPFAGVPFFWTQQYDTRLGYAGYAGDPAGAIIAGRPQDRDFLVYYFPGGAASDRPCGILGTRDTQIAAFAELMRRDSLPTADELRTDPELDLAQRLRTRGSAS